VIAERYANGETITKLARDYECGMQRSGGRCTGARRPIRPALYSVPQYIGTTGPPRNWWAFSFMHVAEGDSMRKIAAQRAKLDAAKKT
jgi:hypothetical protein